MTNVISRGITRCCATSESVLLALVCGCNQTGMLGSDGSLWLTDGRGYAWLPQQPTADLNWRYIKQLGPISPNHVFRLRLPDNFSKNWSGRLGESTRALFYRNVVSDNKFNVFLDAVNIKSHRIILMRLIVSSHRLWEETRPWARPPIPPVSSVS